MEAEGDSTAIFDGAGVADVDVTTRTGLARFSSIRSMVEADLRGWLPVMGVHPLSAFVTEDGKVVFDSPAHIVVGARA